MVRLDVIGEENHATWFMPIAGGNQLVKAIAAWWKFIQWDFTFEQGGFADTSVNFRIKQGWDDDESIRVEMRTILSNGVHSLRNLYMAIKSFKDTKMIWKSKIWSISDVKENYLIRLII